MDGQLDRRAATASALTTLDFWPRPRVSAQGGCPAILAWQIVGSRIGEAAVVADAARPERRAGQ